MPLFLEAIGVSNREVIVLRDLSGDMSYIADPTHKLYFLCLARILWTKTIVKRKTQRTSNQKRHY